MLGVASIRLVRNRLLPGEWAEAVSRFTNTSGETRDVYDPFWGLVIGSVRPAGALELWDSSGTNLGDLFRRSSGHGGEWQDVWRELPPGGICGRRLRFRAGYRPGLFAMKKLPVGAYSVRAVYYDRFLSPNPFSDAPKRDGPVAPRQEIAEGGGLDVWGRLYPGNVPLTSNVEHFELVDDDAPKK